MGKQLAKSIDCAAEFTRAVLSGKWKTIILFRLNSRPCRYSELRASIPGLSDKVLTRRLHDLINSGLVTQRRSATHPTGLYALTPKGRLLDTLLRDMCEWGEQHSRGFCVRVSSAKSVAARRKSR
jgi:DNA-binding HxlR family transcriptional regulator